VSAFAESTRDAHGAPAPDVAQDAALLPLRLSVDRGALSIELTRPHAVGGLTVETLEVLLDGAPFPVDLSRGVKQFRHRRGVLRRLSVRLDQELVGKYLLGAASEVLGEPAIGLRVLPAPLGETTTADGPRADNDARAPTLGMLGISIFGARRALAFDLVLAPGAPPSFIVDGARGVFLEHPALATVLRLLERGLGASPLGFVRKGRAVELSGLVRALLSEIFPGLGFRTPRVAGHVLHRALFDRDGLSLLISADDDPCPVGARALRLVGLAAFTERADDRLAQLDLDGARTELLEVLERVPGHSEVLMNLAEIDAASPLRSESALAFLEEARRSPGDLGSRLGLTARQALSGGLRQELSVEALEQALELEADGTIAALCHCAIAAHASDRAVALAHLDRAVSRAPSHPQPRWLRLEHNLERGLASQGLVDAQQLEALAPAGLARAEVARRVGRLLLTHGQLKEAATWLRRALVSSPDDPTILVDLASTLEGLGEGLRAAELYQMGLARADGRATDLADGGAQGPAESAAFDAARLALARLLASETGDLSLAIGQLRRIGSRSKQALVARELEIAWARKLGDVAALRSAALRLIHGLELGWIVSERAPELLDDVGATLRELGQDDLADHAATHAVRLRKQQ